MASGSSGIPRNPLPNIPAWGFESESDNSDDENSSVGSTSDGDDGELELSDYDSDDAVLHGKPHVSPKFKTVPYPQGTNTTWKAPDGTEWSSVPQQTAKRIRVNSWNVRPGGIGVRTEFPEIAALTSMEDYFCSMMDDQTLNNIVTWTNQKASAEIAKWNEANPANVHKTWIDTNLIEIRAFIGLLLMAGLQKSKKTKIEKLWRSDPKYKRHAFSATMSKSRFEQLCRFLRFDNMDTRAERKATDKLAAIREIVDCIRSNFHAVYEPGEYLTVDEMLVKFRGRCSFRVYMKSKPGRYGLKLWAIVDASSRFVLNFQVYIGKEDQVPEINQGKRVLFDMLQNYLGSGRGVTADNFFGTKKAAEELIAQKITSVFTVRGQRREIPKSILEPKGKDVGSSQFFFSENCLLVGYKTKPKKIVLVMSTQHLKPKIADAPRHKPEMIYHYNATKGGVDTVDQMVGEYSCQRPSRRWPVKIFYQLIDIVALNAFVMWKERNPQWEPKNKSRRQLFLEHLAEALIVPHIKQRNMMGLHRHIKESMVIFGATPPEPTEPAAEQQRNHCMFCGARCRMSCSSCGFPTCQMDGKIKMVCKICDRSDNEDE